MSHTRTVVITTNGRQFSIVRNWFLSRSSEQEQNGSMIFRTSNTRTPTNMRCTQAIEVSSNILLYDLNLCWRHLKYSSIMWGCICPICACHLVLPFPGLYIRVIPHRATRNPISRFQYAYKRSAPCEVFGPISLPVSFSVESGEGTVDGRYNARGRRDRRNVSRWTREGLL